MENVYVSVRFVQHAALMGKLSFTIVTAIANYTTRVVDTRLPKEQILEALLFLGAFFFL